MLQVLLVRVTSVCFPVGPVFPVFALTMFPVLPVLTMRAVVSHFRCLPVLASVIHSVLGQQRSLPFYCPFE